MLTDEEIEAVFDALVAIINLDTEARAFASVARATLPDDTCGPELRARYATVMKPRIAQFRTIAAKHLLQISSALAGAPIH